MKTMRCLFLTVCVCMSLNGLAQNEPESITSEWEKVSQGKLQKKPRFRDPMITVRFIYENGAQFMNLSLKYMFTDAVFEEAVPVEYLKGERLDVHTDKGKYELKSTRYVKARRMNTVAQKIADIRVVFGGDLSFLASKLVKKFVVHYAQGYQNIDLNAQEAASLSKAYDNFLATLPVAAPETKRPQGVPPKRQVTDSNEGVADVQQDALKKKESLGNIRERAKKWNK